jgi:hypothetical protein
MFVQKPLKSPRTPLLAKGGVSQKSLLQQGSLKSPFRKGGTSLNDSEIFPLL